MELKLSHKKLTLTQNCGATSQKGNSVQLTRGKTKLLGEIATGKHVTLGYSSLLNKLKIFQMSKIMN